MPQLDQLVIGDVLAHARGINVNMSRNVFIALTAIAVGAIVSMCGPFGFVGIIAPHTCRLILPGTRHRILSVCSCILGGVFLVVCDMPARTIAPPAEIPMGIITALLGGLFFLFVLFKRKSSIRI